MLAPHLFAISAALLVASVSVHAQEKAASTPVVEVPKHNCAAPTDIPGRLSSETQQKRFKRELDAYRECLTKYADAQRAVAQARQSAANAAAEEYNKFVEVARKARTE